MMQQQRPAPRVRFTLAEWILIVGNLLLGLALGYFLLMTPKPKQFNLTNMLSYGGLFLLLLGYLCTSITLLMRQRRLAALGQLIAALGFWCITAWFVMSVFGPIPLTSWIWNAGLFLLGLICGLVGVWLWRWPQEEDQPS